MNDPNASPPLEYSDSCVEEGAIKGGRQGSLLKNSLEEMEVCKTKGAAREEAET